jgi:hypothetical protein
MTQTGNLPTLADAIVAVPLGLKRNAQPCDHHLVASVPLPSPYCLGQIVGVVSARRSWCCKNFARVPRTRGAQLPRRPGLDGAPDLAMRRWMAWLTTQEVMRSTSAATLNEPFSRPYVRAESQTLNPVHQLISAPDV